MVDSETLKTMVATSPGLVAVIVIVILFVRYLERREKSNEIIHQEHVDERRQCRLALDANAKSNIITAVETQRLVSAISINTEESKRVSNELSNLAITLNRQYSTKG